MMTPIDFCLSLSDNSTGSTNPDEQRQAVELFRQHGALWLRNVIPTDDIDNLAQAYDQQYTRQSVRTLKQRHALVGDHRFMISVAMDPPFRDQQLYANAKMNPILTELLGDQMLISSFGSVVTFPGADAQPIHFDHPPLFEQQSDCIDLPPFAITMVVPLVDLDESTGTTAIWAGTHRDIHSRDVLRELMDKPDFSGAALPYAQRGDVYLMDYRTIHGGTANLGEKSRPILYIVYSRPWFRDSYNFQDQPAIDMTTEQFRQIPAEHQQLFANRP